MNRIRKLITAFGWRQYPLNTFTVFSTLWVIAILIHVNSKMTWFDSAWYMALTAGCVLYLLLPNIRTFLLVLVLQILGCFSVMPYTDNHWFYALMINVAILGMFLPVIVQDRFRFSFDPNEVFTDFMPIIRTFCVGLYFIVVFHKFNTEFFDPDYSCAVHFYERFARVSYFPPIFPRQLSDVMENVLIYWVFFQILVTPILLIRKKTWFWGMLLGASFHIPTMVFMRHFPSFMYTLYFLFIPAEVRTILLARVDGYLREHTDNAINMIRAMVIYGFVFMLVPMLEYAIDTTGGTDTAVEWIKYGHFRTWGAFMVLLWILFVFFIIKNALYRIPNQPLFQAKHRWHWIFTVLFVLNCMMPYLGLKTTTVLSMWSNMRTEAGISNKLIPGLDTLQIFGYQKDVVRIVRSTDKQLDRYADDDLLITWTSLRRRVRRLAERNRTGVEIVYERGGERFSTTNAIAEPELIAPDPLAKFLHFRPFPREGKFPCSW